MNISSEKKGRWRRCHGYDGIRGKMKTPEYYMISPIIDPIGSSHLGERAANMR